jgi:hypothetical protein
VFSSEYRRWQGGTKQSFLQKFALRANFVKKQKISTMLPQANPAFIWSNVRVAYQPRKLHS